MEATRQLRLDALNKHDPPPFQFTRHRAGYRLRLSLGQNAYLRIALRQQFIY